jgi:hypothetical protein
MSAPAHINHRIRTYLKEEVLGRLPPEIQAVSFEVTAWHIEVHTYQSEVFSNQGSEELERRVEGIPRALPERKGEPWQATLAQHRWRRQEPSQIAGELVHAL